jgi:hypothetical protein
MKKSRKTLFRTPSTNRGMMPVRRTPTDFTAALRALQREGIAVSSYDQETGDIWLGLLHGPDVWCRLGVRVERDHFVVSMRAYAVEEALGYVRWRYEDFIDDEVEVGPQNQDAYGLPYCDLSRRFSGMFEMASWTRRMLDEGLESGLEFSARFGSDYSADSPELAWQFAAVAV